MKNSQFPTARTSDLVVQDVPGEVLVYDLTTNKAHCLNETAAMVWRSCDGRHSVGQIADIISLQAGNNVPEDLVWLAIDQLNEINLLESEVKADFKGQTRREVIKKVGLAAVIGLPIVASLAAPTNALAATSCSCTGDHHCTGACGTFCDTEVGRCLL